MLLKKKNENTTFIFVTLLSFVANITSQHFMGVLSIDYIQAFLTAIIIAILTIFILKKLKYFPK